jgi:hypothetical protein
MNFTGSGQRPRFPGGFARKRGLTGAPGDAEGSVQLCKPYHKQGDGGGRLSRIAWLVAGWHGQLEERDRLRQEEAEQVAKFYGSRKREREALAHEVVQRNRRAQ